MDFAVYAVILVASALLSYALRPRPAKEKRQDTLVVPTTEEGVLIPVIFGTVRITPSLTWWGDRRRETKTKNKVKTRYYYLGVQFTLCQGADALLRIRMDGRDLWSGTLESNADLWIDKEGLFGGKDGEGGFKGTIEVNFGRAGQGASSYLTSKAGSPQPAYRDVLTAVFQQPLIAINAPQLKVFTFDVRRRWTGWYAATAVIGNDANPAHIIVECLTNRVWGMGYDLAAIDDTSFMAAADALYAEGFGLSLIWASDETVGDFLQKVLDHINGVLRLRVDTLQYQLRLLRGDYDANNLLVLDENNILDVANYVRIAWGETTNEVVVEYTDMANDYRASTLIAHDYGNLQMQGALASQKKSYPGITSDSLASRVALRDLRALSAPLAKAELMVNRTAWGVTVGDVVRFQWAALGVDTVLRVLSVDCGEPTDQAIRITGVEDVFSLPAAGQVGGQISPWSPGLQDATPVVYQHIIDMPYWLLKQTGLLYGLSGGTLFLYLAADPGAWSYDFYVDSGYGYYEVAPGMNFAPFAKVSGDITWDTTVIPLVATIDLDRVPAGSFALIAGEWMLVTAVDLDTSEITVERGALASIPDARNNGAYVWFIFPDSYAMDGVEYGASQTVNVKALTNADNGQLSIDDAPAESLTLVAYWARPYNVKNLKINNLYFPASIGTNDELSLSWSNTNRVQQTITPPTFYSAGVDLEPACSVKIRFKYIGTTLRVVTTTGTSYTYAAADERSDGGLGPTDPLHSELTVEVWVQTDTGLLSRHTYTHTVLRA